jgi:Zn-dependent peptidase ImmA (M78 family)
MNRRDIEQRATQILQDHGLLDIPVEPLRIANVLGMKVMNAVFAESDKSGAVVRRGGQISIYLNTNDSPARKRFTIAHEIGHRVLHMETEATNEFVENEDNFRATDISDDMSWTPERRREWEANAFAAALLMNEQLVRREWETNKDSTYLAWKFQVSVPAMIIRLTQLGLLELTP